MTTVGAARTLLLLFGFGFALLGIRFFADPAALTTESDVVMPNMKAIMEIRTVYGGMFLGVGLAIAALGWRKETLEAGLLVLIMIAGFVALARIAAIAIGQQPDPLFASLLAIEIVGVAAAAWLWRRLRATSV